MLYMLLGVILLAGAAMVFWAPPGFRDWGLLIIGVVIGMAGAVVAEDVKRRHLRKDLATSFHHELANRVARCLFDFELPWSQYKRGQTVDKFSARKFVPDKPIIYISNADKVALFGEAAPQALMAFYFRLAVIRRDIQNAIDELAVSGNHLDTNQVAMISSRLHQALKPGRAALDALARLVRNPRAIESEAIAIFDTARELKSDKTFRQRLEAAIESPESWLAQHRQLEKTPI